MVRNGSVENCSPDVSKICTQATPLVTLLVSVLLSSCSPDPATEFAPRSVNDPAMASQPAAVAQQVDEGAMVVAAEVQTPSGAPALPEVPRLDESGEKIFIPELGWMPTAEFMDMYENRPEQLPHGINLSVIHEIRQELRNRG